MQKNINWESDASTKVLINNAIGSKNGFINYLFISQKYNKVPLLRDFF